MSLAIIDAREWQNRFDLESGRKIEDQSPEARFLGEVLARNPYPGDTDESANAWVTKTALDLIDGYRPNLVCLSYVQQFFAIRHFDYPQEVKDRILRSAMDEAMIFVEKSGFTPVIVGTGGMIPTKGEMDLSDLDGLAVSSNWSGRYCGLHYPSDADLKLVRSMDAMERVVPKNEWIDLFKSVQPDLEIDQDIDLMPDFLLVAREGFTFKTLGTTLRKPVTLPENNFTVPVYTPLGRIDELRDIKPLIRSGLDRHNIALILVEGVADKYFPQDSFACNTGPDWFCYEPSDAFYLTLSTGKHQPFAYPAGYRSFDQDTENIKFPFSGYMTKIPENTLARDLDSRSIAVGNRSMFMHMVWGVDMSIECFARNLFNQGCLGVLHKKDKDQG